MKYICLYKHPQLPLCHIAQAKTPNDTKEWVCIKAYRYDAPAAAILKQFATQLPPAKAEDIYNIKPLDFIAKFDELIEAAKPKRRHPLFRLIAFLLALITLAVHCATRVALIPLSCCLLILLAGNHHSIMAIAVLYRSTNLTRVIKFFLQYVGERSAK